MLDIVYEDKYLIVVNKPPKLLTIASEKEKNKTLFHSVSMYLKKRNKFNKVFIVHRLDYETSGLVIFAKDERTKQYFQDNWQDVERKYIAILVGKLDKKHDIIESYLKETKTLLTYSTNDTRGKLARTEYEVISKNDRFTMVKINLLTGRKNQIRVHMKDIGHSIVGDQKYGTYKYPYMLLQANSLRFIHPLTEKEISLELKVPKYFEKLG